MQKDTKRNNISFPLLAVFFVTLIIMLGFFLINNYRSLVNLKEQNIENLKQEVQKRAAALSYFFIERRHDLNDLAENRRLAVYFENKALGMSMKYGLQVSLTVVQQLFNSCGSYDEITHHWVIPSYPRRMSLS